MPYHNFIWTPENIEHIADNDVTKQEFEDIVRNPERTGLSSSSSRPCAFGDANDGRFIMCDYEEVDELHILPITAFEVNR